MAFFGPFALLAEGVGELVGSAAVGNAVAGLAQGKAINAALGSIESEIKGLIGQKNIDNFNDAINQISQGNIFQNTSLDNTSSVATNLPNTNPGYQPINFHNSSMEGYQVPIMTNQNLINFSSEVNNQGFTVPNSTTNSQDKIFIPASTLTTNIYVPPSLPEVIQPLPNDALPSEQIQNGLNQLIPTAVPDIPIQDLSQIKKVGTDIGQIIGLQCKYMFEDGQDPLDAFNQAIYEVGAEYLAEPLLEYQQQSYQQPSDITYGLGPDYVEVNAVYNGLNMTLENNLETSIDDNNQRIYLITDEVGGLHTHRESDRGFYLPSYDEYGGPFSKNQGAPETISGLFYMLHDISYAPPRGFFQYIPDLQLICRLTNNFSRMTGQGEYAFAQLAVKYFSTIGVSLAKFRGSVFGEHEEVVDQDILTHFLQKRSILPNNVQIEEIDSTFNDSMDLSLMTILKTQTAVYNPIKRQQYLQQNLEDELLRQLEIYL